jgi:hypothetical protein
MTKKKEQVRQVVKNILDGDQLIKDYKQKVTSFETFPKVQHTLPFHGVFVETRHLDTVCDSFIYLTKVKTCKFCPKQGQTQITTVETRDVLTHVNFTESFPDLVCQTLGIGVEESLNISTFPSFYNGLHKRKLLSKALAAMTLQKVEGDASVLGYTLTQCHALVALSRLTSKNVITNISLTFPCGVSENFLPFEPYKYFLLFDKGLKIANLQRARGSITTAHCLRADEENRSDFVVHLPMRNSLEKRLSHLITRHHGHLFDLVLPLEVERHHPSFIGNALSLADFIPEQIISTTDIETYHLHLKEIYDDLGVTGIMYDRHFS